MGFEGEVWRVGRAPGAPGVPGDTGTTRGGAERAGEEEPGAASGAGAEFGEIRIDDADFPWLSGRFEAGPAYGDVRDLFARELALAERDDAGHWEEWEAVYGEIERRVRLVSPDGPVAGFLLHIRGDRAWFRWSEEPLGGGREPGPEG
ncbi:hypothetical protein ACF1HU_20480 [Streptomyces olivaceus]|uniref:hypothetical protein n=1 Tax=Streptomyces olivaceus TaxID=47716 RepID=UPI00099D9940|nr:hypothetical protein [Streptomyces olivaceus]MBZ6105561.1 hypothetical protein [Streptomyces olivaceus]MBZ6288321.1 hypothetical protein [Streptomyces olivaceus]